MRETEISVRASSPLFKPNGNVRLSESRDSTCELTLIPKTTALTRTERCVLANFGAAGANTNNAVHKTFTSAFGKLVTGGNLTQSASFVIPLS